MSFVKRLCIIFLLLQVFGVYAFGEDQKFPIHQKLPASLFSALKKSSQSIIKNKLQPGCLWTNKKSVKLTSSRSIKQYRTLTNNSYLQIVGNNFPLSFKELCVLCKQNTNTRKRNNKDPTPTPFYTPTAVPSVTNTPIFTPTNSPVPTLPPACTGNSGACAKIFTSINGKPGEVINLSGGMYKTDSSVFLQPFDENGIPVISSRIALQKLSFHPSLMQVEIPANIPLGIWGLWISQNGMTSEVKLVNKPEITHISEKIIASGDELSIWGQMLSAVDLGNFNSAAVFKSDTQSLPAKVIFENKVKVTVIVPDGIISGKKYKLQISNGLSPKVFSTESVELTGQEASSDPLGLKVWWAHEMKFWGNVYNIKTDPRLTLKAIGNGFVDDAPAIQAALNYAGSHGGGIVYLPPGTYRTKTDLRIYHPRVVLQGASTSSTIITYGELDTLGKPTAAAYFAENNVTHSGFANVTFRNLNRSGITNISIRTYTKVGIQKIFLKGVKGEFGPDGEGIVITVPHLLISDCEINHDLHYIPPQGLYTGPINVGNLDVVFRNNTVRYNGGRISVSANKDLFLLGNTFIRNADPAILQERIIRGIETGGVEFSFTINPVIDSNIIKSTQPLPEDHYNDGESLMSQTSIYFKSSIGEISSATETSITDNSRIFTQSDITSPMPEEFGSEMYLAIVRGPGLGQSSKIVGINGNSLILDPETPFKILPTSSSSYIITQWVNVNPVIFNNTIQNGRFGILIYDGGKDLNIHQNHLIDAGNIFLRANDIHRGTLDELRRFPGWNTSITNNTVESTLPSTPSGIKISAEQFVPKVLHGNTVFNTQVRDNNIISSVPVAPERELFDKDGYLYVTAGGGGTECNGNTYYPDFPYASLGTVLSGNLLTDINGANHPERFYQSRCTYSVNNRLLDANK